MTTEAKAAVYRELNSPLSIEDIQVETPRPDEILVKMVATGICHTDVKITETDYVPRPIVLGHEGAGIVEQVGAAVTDLRPGDHVVLSIDFCGGCRSCLNGSPAYCDEMLTRHFSGGRVDGSSPLTQDGQTVHGMFFAQSSFATHAVAPARAAVSVDRDVPLELLGPLGCGIQTGAGAVLRVIDSPYGSSLAVWGAGSLGLSAIAAARIAGMHPIVAVDRVPSRLELAKEFGATHVVDTANDEPVEAVREATGGGADFAWETTGVLINAAFDALDGKGQLLLAAAWETLSFEGRDLLLGKSIRGVAEGDSVPRIFIPQLIDLYRRGEMPLDRLVQYFDFEDINQAMDASRDGSVVKPVIRF